MRQDFHKHKFPMTEDNDTPFIDPAHVRERDIDLLLLEELYASDDFQRHFLNLLRRSAKQGSPPQHVEFLSARRSIWDEYGQCDLLVKLRYHEGSHCYLLIENKIDAELQPNQSDRYRMRGEEYVRRGCCSAFCTVLAAPQKYLEKGAEGFDGTVSYEGIRNWFENTRELGQRRLYKLALLDAALAAKKPATVAFFEFYLKRVPSELKPSKSANRIKFQPPSLPEGIFIIHRLIRGWVELRLSPSEKLDQSLENDMEKVRVVDHLAIRLEVTPIHLKKPFTPQQKAVEQGIAAAQRLLDWFNQQAQIPAL